MVIRFWRIYLFTEIYEDKEDMSAKYYLFTEQKLGLIQSDR